MDFLDPSKKRTNQIKLTLRYLIMTTIVAIGTVILVYEAYGFGYDRQTGQVIQNGLVFVDSSPVSAEIYLNGNRHDSNTDARLVLPSAQYTFELKRQGYYNWQRTFYLEAGSLERLVYPLMIPTSLSPKIFDTLVEAPAFSTQSPDRRWLLQQMPATNNLSIAFNEYDTTVKPAPQKQVLSLPPNIIKATGGNLKELEWSSDNRHFLVEYQTPELKEFIVVDREDPARSFNVNNVFGINPQTVAMRDKKFDQLYLLLPESSAVVSANVTNRTVGQPIISNVLYFKPYGNDTLTYITNNPTSPDIARAAIWNDGQTYALNDVPKGEVYFADSARFDGEWYFVAGSNKMPKVPVHKNPIDNLKNSQQRLKPFVELNLADTKVVSFSANARFIGAQSGQNFAVYDFESKDNFNYSVDVPLSGSLRWMDGHRWIGNSGSKVFMMDFDGINRQSLVATNLPTGGYFDRDYRQMYISGVTEGQQSLSWQRVAIYSEADMPDNLK